jgi:hypothetical protein
MACKKRRKVTQLELEGVEFLETYLDISQRFIMEGWFNFSPMLHGYHEKISLIFSQNFDGLETMVGKVLIHVTEHSIRTTCRLSMYGERWWKKEEMPMKIFNQVLLLEHQDPNWSQGIPHRSLKKEWKNSLMVIHMYIIYEGCFSFVQIYHIRSLMHLNYSGIPLCIPLFLLKISTKMPKIIQSNPATASKSFFHQRLIKVLVMYALDEVNHSWDWLIESLELK